ncbi:MAG: M48 family metallopeptidase [Dechloromonas sp.]|nr:M48 family metallopeptidase [Dechloromonas sp.]
MPSTLTFFFLLALACFLLTQSLLKWRHIRHIQAHRAQVPAEFSHRISLASHQKAADYTVDRSRLALVGQLSESVLLLVLTLGGGLALLHDFWATHSSGLSYGLALILSVLGLSALVDLPLTLYKQFVIEARYGFNRMRLGLFFSDLARSTALGLLIGAPLILVVLWLMERMGDDWWLTTWIFWCSFNLLLLFIYPTWIAPLFNKFTPLAEGEMKTRIEDLLQRCGFNAAGLFVMDGSKRSGHGNAYFTGFGRNKRIVFFDTLLERLSPGEIEAVLAHELGHFRKHHVLQRLLLSFAGSLLLLWLLGQLMHYPTFYNALGVPTQSTALALILFFLVIPLFLFPLGPLSSRWSRRHEFEADAYAAEHASASDLVRALVKLYDDNAATLTPDPLHSLFYDSHPPAAQRIAHLQRLENAA